VLGLLASAALIALFVILPARIPGTPVNIATALVFYKLCDVMQGPAFFKHRAAAGARRSNWLVVAVIAATIVALLAVLLGLFLATGRLDDELALAATSRG